MAVQTSGPAIETDDKPATLDFAPAQPLPADKNAEDMEAGQPRHADAAQAEAVRLEAERVKAERAKLAAEQKEKAITDALLAQARRGVALDFESFQAQMQKVFKTADRAQDTIARETPDIDKVRATKEEKRLFETYPIRAANDETLVLANDRSVVTATERKIAFEPAKPAQGAQPASGFTRQDAVDMVALAVRNLAMLEKGIKVSGTAEERKFLVEAIEEHNATAPAHQRLKYREVDAAAPAPEPQPKTDSIPVSLPTAKTAPTHGSAPPVPAIPSQRSAKQDAMTKKPSRLTASFHAVAKAVPKVFRVVWPNTPQRPNRVEPTAQRTVNKDSMTKSAVNTIARRGIVAAFVGGAAIAPTSASAWTSSILQSSQAQSSVLTPAAEGAKQHYMRVLVDPPRKKSKESKSAFERREQKYQRSLKRAEARYQIESQQEIAKPTARQTRKEKLLAKQAERNLDKQQTSFFSSSGGGSILFRDTHSSNSMRVNFSEIGSGSCCSEFNRFARDRKNHQEINMDQSLLRYLEGIATRLRAMGYSADEFHLVSGYRSRATNEGLRRTRGGQAKNSQHCYGRALDITVTGVSASVLQKVADQVVGSHGGVGGYSGFVHVDTRGNWERWGIGSRSKPLAMLRKLIAA